MIAVYYQYIYLSVVVILTIIAFSRYSQITLQNLNRVKTKDTILSFCIAVLIILFIGFRPLHAIFYDMVVYEANYNSLLLSDFFFERETDNIIFDNWLSLMASQGIPFRTVMIIFSIVYFGAIWFSCKRLFPRDSLLAFVVYLAAFSTFSYATNGVKAGMAASLFCVALAYYDHKLISILLALLTYGMHHSMKLVIVAYFIILFIKNPKYYFMVWGFSFLMAALHITWFQHFFAGFTDEHGAGYLLSERDSGFRIDFIVYSAVPVIIGYYMIYKQKLQSNMYNVILSLYLLTNSVWMLCMYSNFTNRISYLSWFLYPIVLLYPFVNIYWSNRQYTYLKYVVWGHLGFTLFMTVIFYGLLGL